MAFDAHKNLAIASVVTPPSPAASGTTLVVSAGQGARFGAVPFNATVWPIDMAPDPTTAEVVRVTARTTDTLTIVRAQEGTTARTILAGDLFAATITAKSLTDIESGTNFPLITTPGAISTGGDILGPSTGNFLIRPSTNDGADVAQTVICGGGGSVDTRGAAISVLGNEVAGSAGDIYLVAGAPTGKIHFFASGDRGTIHPSGGFSWGSTNDPGSGNLRAENLLVTGTATAANQRVVTGGLFGADASSGSTFFCGGTASNDGGYLRIFGNSSGTNPGAFQFIAGNPAGFIGFYPQGGAIEAGRVHASGGLSWGGATNPGVGNVLVGNGIPAAGNAFVMLRNTGQVEIGQAGTAAAYVVVFWNGSGGVGSITTSASATAYNTTSDARLKTPLNRHTSVDVLRDTVIHNFHWKSDHTPGRGVFAQEAVHVLPSAVSVGTDERDAGGNLTHPWGVDYSKYVPDLITGWQQHDDRLDALEEVLNRTLSVAPPRPSLPKETVWLGLSVLVGLVGVLMGLGITP